MSGYNSAPFGQPGDHPHRPPLPPPRPRADFPLGRDFHSRHGPRGESVDSERNRLAAGNTRPHRRSEQLPSLRQLLAPAPGVVSPPSLPQSYPPSEPSRDHSHSSHSVHHHEPTFVSRPAFTVHENIKSSSEPILDSESGSLPPFSQLAAREVKHHAATRSDPSVILFQTSQPPLHGPAHHAKALSGDISLQESAKRSKTSTVLPHVVDEKYIEGEGLCYIYADGSHCPKTVEGVPVNANWGITKAGRPRKRLAQACLTCREKKIKCQPNLPKCDQCQKSGRKCRFESVPRGNRSSFKGPRSASTGKLDAQEGGSPDDHATSDISVNDVTRAPGSATSQAGASDHSPIFENCYILPTGTGGAHEAFDDTNLVPSTQSHRLSDPIVGSDSLLLNGQIERNRLPQYTEVLNDIQQVNDDDPLSSSWSIDPYEADPEMAIHYIESFFTNVNNSLYHILPHTRFILWVKSGQTKSAKDKMLLYCMMALGSIFSDRPDSAVALRQYSRIALFAIQKSQSSLSLQLAQSHLIMSLWYYASGSLVGSWDSIGAAARIVSGLRYNLESGGIIVEQDQICDYGMHPQALMECRRRTYWVSYILDRFATFFTTSSAFIPSESSLIRLPCLEEIYEAQQYATTPYFQSILNETTGTSVDHRSALSPLAVLIQILTIWGDASSEISRLSQIPSGNYAPLAEDLRTNIMRRTDEWSRGLPEYLTFSTMNMERASQTKNADVFISIHMIYHATLLKLFRHTRYQSMRHEVLAHHIHRARYHAAEILRIAKNFLPQTGEFSSRSNHPPPSSVTVLNPFVHYVIMSAIDVLSAAGMMAELSDCITFVRGSLALIECFSRHWDSSLELVNVIQKRLNTLTECLGDRLRTRDNLCFSVNCPSLETRVHLGTPFSHGMLDEDLFYGSMPREMLLRTISVDAGFTEGGIAWLQDR